MDQQKPKDIYHGDIDFETQAAHLVDILLFDEIHDADEIAERLGIASEEVVGLAERLNKLLWKPFIKVVEQPDEKHSLYIQHWWSFSPVKNPREREVSKWIGMS